jgi:hypothetical protein
MLCCTAHKVKAPCLHCCSYSLRFRGPCEGHPGGVALFACPLGCRAVARTYLVFGDIEGKLDVLRVE